MQHIIAECNFERPFTDEDESLSARAIDRNLELSGSRWMRTYFSQDRRRMICEFDAPDAETVKAAYAAAGCPLDTVWEATVSVGEAIPG